MKSLSQIFNEAADLIEEYGHHKGWFWDDKNNTPCMCILGACCNAYTGCLKSGASPLPSPLGQNILDALAAQTGARDVAGWNDRPERTQQEVVSVLRAAAEVSQ